MPSQALWHLIDAKRQNWRGFENQSFLWHLFISDLYKNEGDLGIDRNEICSTILLQSSAFKERGGFCFMGFLFCWALESRVNMENQGLGRNEKT